MKRKYNVVITVDIEELAEEIKSDNNDILKLTDDNIKDLVRREFNWLGQSGIFIDTIKETTVAN